MSTPRHHTTRTDAAGTGTFSLAGDQTVNRLGFGAMRLPADPGQARALLRRAVELGVGLIDTAEFYGPGTSERLIAEALWPYPDGLLIATKGLTHPPDRWGGQGHAGRLREAVEGSLRRLRLERIDLYQLARIDPTLPAADQFGVLAELRQQGKVGHVGLSEVGVDQVQAARKIVPVASVQNRYSLAERAWEPVVDHCEREGIAFLPWFPLGAGRLAEAGGGAGGGRAALPGHGGPGRPGLAAAALPGHAADPRHLLGRAPGGEPGRLDAAARRRRVPAAGPDVSRPTHLVLMCIATRSRSGSDDFRDLVASGRPDG
jgi:pyridoxine 4-dehydrogenase